MDDLMMCWFGVEAAPAVATMIPMRATTRHKPTTQGSHRLNGHRPNNNTMNTVRTTLNLQTMALTLFTKRSKIESTTGAPTSKKTLPNCRNHHVMKRDA